MQCDSVSFKTVTDADIMVELLLNLFFYFILYFEQVWPFG